ncbi:bacterio-opsin activator domain-containing protein, partial [Natronoarchaeum mannanilyticum]|uniref:bacterio-opsin activator domain-containing protein n=1 Tax=Natronoarchaeum mannanilyticum TaxID=926360 RepID=UPI00361388E1
GEGSVVDADRVGAVTAVPLAHRETTYSVLAVATDRGAPEDWEGEELSALGRRIGHALTAIQRRNLLLSDAAVELEFRCRDEGAVFVDASARLDCTFSLESIAPVSASSLLFHVTVADADPGDVFDLAVEHRGVEEVRLVETHGDGALLEFVVGGDSPLLTLAAHGATITDAVFESGDGDLVAEVAQDADLRAVVDGLRTAFPDTELVGKREVERPVQTVREFREGVEDELTDRQEATLRAAYYAGYFDWPRGSTAEEVADSMDVSSPTLHNHLRKGQRALLDTFFEGSVGGE